ncbi:MAG: response regulator, partial [Nitrospira sp.]|nr:response regulator [Nitrospira sp.]
MIESIQSNSQDESLERRVLIVDDDRDFAESLVDILEPRGYQFAVAHSIEDAQEVAKDFDAQVALLDIRLGRSNGLNLVATLK